MQTITQNIPAELRQLHQWVAAREDGAPIDPKNGRLASVTDPSTWATFEQAFNFGGLVGFVLTKDDPFVCFDLDDKVHDPATEEQKQRFYKIAEACDSYTEISRSGRGYHIFVKGALPNGQDRDKVAIYPHSRHIIMTGNIVWQKPIRECQDVLNNCYEQMGGSVEGYDLVELDAVTSDDEILRIASNASNGKKFIDLWSGIWTGYASRSEAEHALISMLCYYSASNDQVRRMFKRSPLAQRPKSQNVRRIDNSIRKIRKASEVDIQIERKFINEEKVTPEVQYPPGLVGELAEYIYNASIRPTKEISIAAALGFIGALAGRCYNISGTGLNQYIIVLAKTGTGKEAGPDGINKIISQIKFNVPQIDEYVGPSDFASGAGLVKTLPKQKSFVSILGEFGITLQQICSPRASSPERSLKRVLLDLYSKSGASAVIRPRAYSDSEKTIPLVQSPALTILADATQESFFQGITSYHIAEGLLPRFLTIEYRGDRVPRNLSPNTSMNEGVKAKLLNLVQISVIANSGDNHYDIPLDDEAQKILDGFDQLADRRINAAKEGVTAQLWNRAHLKAMKLAALIAVGIDPHAPIVDALSASWAVTMVQRDVQTVENRFNDGNTGTGDAALHADLVRVVKEYYTNGIESAKKYKVSRRLYNDGILPYAYLSRRLIHLASFDQDRRGATNALRTVIYGALDAGILVEVGKDVAQTKYGTRSRLFTVTDQL